MFTEYNFKYVKIAQFHNMRKQKIKALKIEELDYSLGFVCWLVSFVGFFFLLFFKDRVVSLYMVGLEFVKLSILTLNSEICLPLSIEFWN